MQITSVVCRTVPCSKFPGSVFSLQLNPPLMPRLHLWMTAVEGFAVLSWQHRAVGIQDSSALSVQLVLLPLRGWVNSFSCHALAKPWLLSTIHSSMGHSKSLMAHVRFLPRASMELNCGWGACCKQMLAGINPACILDT